MKTFLLALVLTVICRADTIFSNITGTDCSCGIGNTAVAAAFTPAMNSVITSVGAELEANSLVFQSGSFGLSLFSNVDGFPSLRLGSLGSFPYDQDVLQPTLFTALTPIPLNIQAGVQYWLVITGDVVSQLFWAGGGSAPVPTAYTVEISDNYWIGSGQQALQFEINGSFVTAAPEAANLSLIGLGLIGSALFFRRAGATTTETPRISS